MSTPHGGFSETNINSTGNQKTNKQTKYSRIVNKQLLRNYLHTEFMTSQIDYEETIKKLFIYKFMTLKIDLKGRLSFYV